MIKIQQSTPTYTFVSTPTKPTTNEMAHETLTYYISLLNTRIERVSGKLNDIVHLVTRVNHDFIWLSRQQSHLTAALSTHERDLTLVEFEIRSKPTDELVMNALLLRKMSLTAACEIGRTVTKELQSKLDATSTYISQVTQAQTLCLLEKNMLVTTLSDCKRYCALLKDNKDDISANMYVRWLRYNGSYGTTNLANQKSLEEGKMPPVVSST